MTRLPLPHEIIAATIKVTGIDPELMTSPSRKDYAVNARGVAAYVMRTVRRMSLSEIGHAVGRKHNTLIPLLAKVEASPRLMEHVASVIAEAGKAASDVAIEAAEKRGRTAGIEACRAGFLDAVAMTLTKYQIPPDEIHAMMRRVEAVGTPVTKG